MAKHPDRDGHGAPEHTLSAIELDRMSAGMAENPGAVEALQQKHGVSPQVQPPASPPDPAAAADDAVSES